MLTGARGGGAVGCHAGLAHVHDRGLWIPWGCQARHSQWLWFGPSVISNLHH
jgi:hypothetical protein